MLFQYFYVILYSEINKILKKMKKNIITEAVNEVVDKYLSFTAEELHSDYDRSDTYDNAEKKALMAKYNAPSKKAKDIQNCILVELRNLRKKATSFTIDDLRDFTRLNTGISIYSKFKDAMDQESKAFAKFFFTYYEEKIAKNGWEKFINYSLNDLKWIAAKNHFRAYEVDDTSKMYKHAKKYLYENSSEAKSKEDLFADLEKKFHEKMADFKVAYLNEAEEYGRQYYAKCPSIIEKYTEIVKKYDMDMDARKKEVREDPNITYSYWHDYQYNALDHARSKASKVLNEAKMTLKRYTEDTYAQKERDDAEDRFNHNVKALVQRVVEKGLILDKIEIFGICEDPKFFEMHITDGNFNLYARSIWAAEGSSYVTPHFRFIITNKKSHKSRL